MRPSTPLLLTLLSFCVFLMTSAKADDTAVTKALEALGGKVQAQNGTVTQLSFTDCSKLGADEFKSIGELVHLKNLTLYGKCQGLNDSTLPLLSNLKDLETLGVDGAQITDAGLSEFSNFTNLKSLSFFHLSFRMEGFTGVGLGNLQKCAKLERLTVAGMSIGDDAFAAIANITQLKELLTWHTFQTEAGNLEIAKLPNLQSLKLGQRLPRPEAKAPSLSDISIPTLSKIKTLESLKIGEAHFTVDGLMPLKELPNLKTLVLYETDLPLSDVGRLAGEFPGKHIDFQPLTEEQAKKLQMYLKQ